MSTSYTSDEPSRADVDALPGSTVIEFGANWCGICMAAQPAIGQAFAQHPGVRHLKIEDGPGRPLGRSFGIKLWPTLVFMRDGQELERLVRPTDSARIAQALARQAATDQPVR
ncbi:thioredoxin family protein [Piscinibacter sp. XHJ-5]|uniref:thioredoxin family protein n=1 Tax=Piscinibacter sp. XHJ-5 TaxID=3037797 RepID=UPI002452E2AD|nr:thioredoxin family protein [Piscinibacter sp. XHJ-5]